MDICTCAIYDGNDFFFGLSPGFEHPKKIIGLVKEGKNISKAYRELGLTDHEYVGHSKGAINILSKERMTRKEYIIYAVKMALISLQYEN